MNFIKLVAVLCCSISIASNLNILLLVNGEVTKIDSDKYRVTFLNIPGKQIECCNYDAGFRTPPLLEIFCYRGTTKELVHLWETVSVELSLAPEEYERYEGSSPQEVIAEYEAHRSSWSINIFTWKSRNLRLDPFVTSCVGISSNHHSYNVLLNVIRIDFWKPVLLLCGIALYVLAPKLSDNPLFYYICGISLGICASLLILVYLISKLIPKRPMMYGFVIGGWTIGVYMIQMLWENLRVIVYQHQSRVLMYIVATGLISFVVCYRMGPVSDPRSKNLIKWALQGASFLMMYFSSQYHEAVIAIITVFLAARHFPQVWRSTLISCWKKSFPPKLKNLTNEEYYMQGIVATNEGIEELRRYCGSPECDTWRTVRKLKDPLRFAKFMAGTSHLNDEEVLNYEVNDIIDEDIDLNYSVSDDESD